MPRLHRGQPRRESPPASPFCAKTRQSSMQQLPTGGPADLGTLLLDASVFFQTRPISIPNPEVRREKIGRSPSSGRASSRRHEICFSLSVLLSSTVRVTEHVRSNEPLT